MILFAPTVQLRAFLLSPAARPLRFAGTGGVAGVTQLLLLSLLLHLGWDAFIGNAVAFLAAAQVNFVLSSAFTWRDRLPSRSRAGAWLLFHGSIALTAAFNMLAFVLAHSVLHALLASLAGIAVGAIGNYLVGDRIVFRQSGTYARRQRSHAA